jgi:hypothetical protein
MRQKDQLERPSAKMAASGTGFGLNLRPIFVAYFIVSQLLLFPIIYGFNVG